MIRIEVDPFPAQADLDALWLRAWGGPCPGYATRVLPRSACHIGAYAQGELIGLVNLAWDGGVHGFVLDTCVAPAWRRQGIAAAMVNRAVEEARAQGLHWLHVDHEPHLDGLYAACGFRPTRAGLIALR